MSQAVKVDRATLVRRALVELVAENGFRGTSMAAVAERAGVATGTAYVHYGSKDELVVAAYAEVKSDLGVVLLNAPGSARGPEARFRQMWHAIYDHLAADRARARFLAQVEVSPYAAAAHDAAMADSVLMRAPQLGDIVARLVPLPPTVLWALGFGPAISLAAADNSSLTAAELALVAKGCWRALTID